MTETPIRAFSVRPGSMLMEFVLTMPILVILIMLVLQFAQLWLVREVVSYAAFCAARSTLCVVPAEQSDAAKKAAMQVLAWVNTFGSDGGTGSEGTYNAGAFSDIKDGYEFNYYEGSSDDSGNLKIPGWGGVPESSGLSDRVSVELDIKSQSRNIGGKKPVASAVTVKYKFPMLVPIAGQMISYLAKHSASESKYVKSKDIMPGWTGEEETFGGVPYIELVETGVVPMPYSTVNFPFMAYK